MSEIRLIDAEALKEAFEQVYPLATNEMGGVVNKRIYDIINNAPTVPERGYSQGWHDAITKALNEAYMITSEDGSFKVVQTETLEGLGMSMPMPERPRGEWVKVKEDRMSIDMSGEIATLYKCSKCGRMIATFPSKLADYPFCHCGAAMRKGGAE